ncbi:MAG: bifunctional phosphoribosylaminoimidazolecarboxamide formyltransferase/IMP cyclohydrolase [Candidatus Omnitrophota bacterium]
MIKIKRALISVSDKQGVLDFARGLNALGIQILSTGGTAKILSASGIPVTEVSEWTGFPEMLDGRVKTLHPKIHAGLLALRDNPNHMRQTQEHNIGLIDMVVVNLYPFRKAIQRKGISLKEAIENIDIGGPSMLRSAAKNYRSVAVVCNPEKYKDILSELKTNNGILSDAVLSGLALEVFRLTASYDKAIFDYLKGRFSWGPLEEIGFPNQLKMVFEKAQDLRYGENPHQKAVFYRAPQDNYAGLSAARQLSGKDLSFNNILDLDAALRLIAEFSLPAAVVIKHNNPCGVAEDKQLLRAFSGALRSDPLSAFGSIIGFNRFVDEAVARAVSKAGFVECVFAPRFDRSAVDILSRKKNLRIIVVPVPRIKNDWDFKRVCGGLLAQDADDKVCAEGDLKIVTKKRPGKAQVSALLFAFKVAKHVRSNAIVLARGQRSVGIGAGQMSRVDSVIIAARKAGKLSAGSVCASDAFFPKEDAVLRLARAGVKAIIQPGGSIADDRIIQTCDKKGISMVFTNIRHFRH